MKLLNAFFFCSCLLIWCQCAVDNKDEKSESTTSVQKENSIHQNEASKIRPTLTPFTPSRSFENAEIKGYTYKEGKFEFDLADGDYKLGTQTPDAPQKMCANSAQGQHIHMIIDNRPYSAHYETTFEKSIQNGGHDLLAFLSRSYHESIKDPKAYKAERVQIEGGQIVNRRDIDTPSLFYSRPKGVYVGKENTEKVMLDYYLVNIPEDQEYKVRAVINEHHTFLLDKWQPYYIEGLPLGKNTITLSLIGPDGKEVNQPSLPVTRRFVLKADPAG